MSCCPSGVPPEGSIDNVVTHGTETRIPVNMPVPPANNGES